jgi:Ca-activated chloride channel family protein
MQENVGIGLDGEKTRRNKEVAFMRFEFPRAFLILLALPFLIWLSHRGRRTGTLRFSSVQNARRVKQSWRIRLRHLPLVLRIIVLVLLTVGLARPQEGKEEVRELSEGIAIEMVVDRSGSMGQEMVYEKARVSRLDVVKEVFKEFILGNGKDLKGRPNDLIGMITFARYADTVCPLTLSHGALDRFIENVQVVKRKSEDGTAIGDGLALAAARLKTAEKELKKRGAPEDDQEDYTIKSKVIILLTDGQNNAGKRTPMEAARLAKEWGIKVYTIGIGGDQSLMTIRTPLGNYKLPGGPGVEEKTLKAIAKETGGVYRRATTADRLRDIYKEIDEMERTEIESIRYMDYSEHFTPFLVGALVVLFLEQFLLSTIFRRIP